MPLEYREPKWKYKREYARPYCGNFERDLFKKAIDQIPRGAECKITIQWNDNPVDTKIQKILKEFDKSLKHEKD